MSACNDGVAVSGDDTVVCIQRIKDKSLPAAVKSVTEPVMFQYSNVQSKNCNGSKNTGLYDCSLDGDLENEDMSPDISLSSQKTLRYSDVESEESERGISHENSTDSFPTSREQPKEDLHSEVRQACPVRKSPQSVGKDSTECTKDQNYVSSEDSHEVILESSSASRPESLSLPHPFGLTEQLMKHEQSCKDNCGTHMRTKVSPDCGQAEGFQAQDISGVRSKNCVSQNLPQGTITRKGDMIQFVADDFMQKIKQSSPMSHADTASTGSRRSSIRSTASASSSTSFATSSGVSRSPSSGFQQSPDDIPPIDASAVIELENLARKVADSIDLMMGNIRNNLHKMSALTIGCQEAYKRSVDITCDSVDAGIKSMYALMAKCEELSISMKPVEQLAIQIREIKRILDLFEAQVTDK